MRLVRLVALAFSVFAVAALSPSTASFAKPQNANVSTRTHEKALLTPTGKFVQDLGDRAIAIVADKKLSSDDRTASFRTILGECFDLKTIGRFVIGRSWKSATPEQQVEYMDLFQSLVIRNYGSRMALYTGEGFEVIGTRPESELDTTVLSQITHPDGSQPTSIDWRVRTRNGKMGIIDVIVEGVSLSVTQKQEYASVIQRNGGHLEGLLALMRDQLKEREARVQ